MKKRTALLLSVSLFVIAAAVFVILRSNGSGRASGSIILPQSLQEDVFGEDIAVKNTRNAEEIVIDAGNVKSVISTLLRPEQYEMESQIFYYFPDGAESLTTRVYSKDGNQRIIVSDSEGSVLKNVLLTLEDMFIWGEDEQNVYKGKRGMTMADDEALIPSYEIITEIPDEEIRSAGIETFENRLCISVERKEKDTGIEQSFYVDVGSGLLYAFFAYENGDPIYEMHRESLVTGNVPDALFALPQGAAG